MEVDDKVVIFPLGNMKGNLVALKAGRDCNYFEQGIPLLNNKLLTIDTTPADKDFIPADTLGADGLISSDDTKVQRVLLIVMGTASNVYSGANALNCAVPAYNEWQAVLDAGSYFDLEPNGQMLTDDWPTAVEGAIHTFVFSFNVTNQITNIDGNIGLTIRNGCSKQDSLKVTVTTFLKILWKV